jgi:hypothetical protein
MNDIKESYAINAILDALWQSAGNVSQELAAKRYPREMAIQLYAQMMELDK